MRAMFAVTVSFLIGASLIGCDRFQKAQAPAPAPVAAAVPVCNCPQQAQPSTPPVKEHRLRSHRHWWHGKRSYQEARWSSHENSSSSYVSSTEPGYTVASDASNASEMMESASIPPQPHGAPFPPPPPDAQAQASVWVDGYHRGHDMADAQELDDGNSATLTAKDLHRRLAPWHAYDVDCDRAE
jgi:hypothetical protein